MTAILKVPYLGTAEEDVLVAQWLVDEGQAFKRGETVVVVETLKASFEVEAEDDGVLLRRLAEAGQRVPLQAPLAVTGAPGEALDEELLAELLADREAATPVEAEVAPAPPPPAVAGGGAGPPCAPAARRRATELGLDLSGLRGTGPGGLIRLEDVEAAGQGNVGDGTLDPDFVAYLRREGRAFATLSSEFKVGLYRRHGARLGEGVSFGEGALVIAERLVLGAGSRIADGCRVEARELIAGELLHLGPHGHLRCTRLVLGDNAYFAEQVEIGGGGALDPQAELILGSHGFVGEHVHLNPCRRLEVGDEVVISRSAAIMTHSFGGSLLAGYPVRFAGVKLGDGCQVGIGASLFPGAEMGPGSILLSGSTLVSAVPAGRLYGGAPAVDLKAAARPLSPAELAERARAAVLDFAEQLALRGFQVGVRDEAKELVIDVTHAGAVHRLRYAAGALGEDPGPVAEELRVGLRLGDSEFESTPPEVVAIDLSTPRIRGVLGPLAGAFREFLRKRGVRLHPRTWTYPGGWL